MSPSPRNKFFRLAFCIDGEPAGSMLVVCPSVEIAISRGAAEIHNQTGKHIEVISCGTLFWSDDEEKTFFKVINIGGMLEGFKS